MLLTLMLMLLLMFLMLTLTLMPWLEPRVRVRLPLYRGSRGDDEIK
jgi:hypothetical protein